MTQVTHKYNYKQQIRLTVFPLGSSLLPLWAKSLLFVTAEFRAWRRKCSYVTSWKLVNWFYAETEGAHAHTRTHIRTHTHTHTHTHTRVRRILQAKFISLTLWWHWPPTCGTATIFVNYVHTIIIAQYSQLSIPLTIIFPRAASEAAHSNGSVHLS